jgi:mono/diheme cytochrome c family protein
VTDPAPPPRSVGVIGLVVIAVVLFGGVGHWLATRSTRSHAPGSLDGSQLYQQYCARCHQPDLKGDGHYPALVLRVLPPAAFDRLVREGSATMPSFADSLDATDLARLRDYIESVRAGAKPR